MSPNYKVHYLDMGTAGEHAQIEDRDGWYVCTVEQCSGEGRSRFRTRALAVLAALERAADKTVTTNPKARR